MLLLLLFAFIAGIVTVLSPCILPVLPIVLSGSVTGGKKRPFGVVTGFILSFTFFTLFLSAIVQATGLSANNLRLFSVFIIVLFGASLLIPQMQLVLERAFSFFSRFSPTQSREGFGGGLLVGLSLGLVWTPCVGPILAAVISLAITGSVSGSAALITLAYALGTGLPMLAITYGGREMLQRVPWLLSHTASIQKSFGVIMIITGIAIFFNVDRQFQVWVLNAFPNYGVGLTQFEDNKAVKEQLESLRTDGTQSQIEVGSSVAEIQEQMNYPMAPELEGGTNWINSEPLRLDGNLQGKVVLVDFWTYSCINCIRTMPYLRDWHDKYKDKGLVIVGVHAPEFEFEKDADNVREAMADFELEYPVVQDNNFAIWRAYSNRYWPAKYLIDKTGRVRYTHFGEGKYLETENKIRELLGEDLITQNQELQLSQVLPKYQTRETYLGYGRAQSYTTQNKISVDQEQTYDFLKVLADDAVGLKGDWIVGEENVLSTTDGSQLSLNFQASQVYLVMDAQEDSSGKVSVLLDGQPLPEKYQTDDTNQQGEIIVDSARKYDILDLCEDYGRHTLTLVFDQGVEAYAFTFGT